MTEKLIFFFKYTTNKKGKNMENLENLGSNQQKLENWAKTGIFGKIGHLGKNE